jgi:hypothetical protein
MTWKEHKEIKCVFDNTITCKYASVCKKECRYLKRDRRFKQ